jgi:excisionase family DNA binding protein
MGDKTTIGAPEETLWTAIQVAHYLNVSRSWVYRETAAGRLPCVRILSLVRYDPAEIKAFRERGKRTPGRVLVPFETRPGNHAT